jgi:sialate O-acetylesterase
MKISSGLFNHMVLQRTDRNVCDVLVEGTCNATGPVWMRVARRGRKIKSRLAGRAAAGKFISRVSGLGAGGPYDITLEIRGRDGAPLESLNIRNVLVGDVWLLGGQSNMQGVGHYCDAEKTHPLVRAFYMNDEWAVAHDPIHNLSEAVDTVHNGWPGPHKPRRRLHIPTSRCVGPGVSFGRAMLEATGVPQGLVACAHGGTTMKGWDQKLKKLGSKSLYGAMMRRFKKNGGRVAGLVWYQGCSDADPVAVKSYRRNMISFVRALRRDTLSPRLPVVMVQIAGVCGTPVGHDASHWNIIQEEQRRLPEFITRLLTVPAIDLSLDDRIHVSGKDQQRLGRRLAQAMRVLLGDRRAGLPPITLRDLHFAPDRLHGDCLVKVRFNNVMGGLQSPGRPAGFVLRSPKSEAHVFRVDLRGPEAHLKTLDVTRAMSLHYGYGYAPYCNITDTAGRSLPVFGPLAFDRPDIVRVLGRELPAAAGSPLPGSMVFPRKVLVSRAQDSAGKLEKLDYPANHGKLGFKPREFPAGFWDLHEDLLNCAPEDVLVYYKTGIVCKQPMRLALCFGYDGPVKIWVNRRQVYHDPLGSNPATDDKFVLPFKAAKGKHEILIALGSNHGRAWGAKMRVFRRDHARKHKGNEIAMPAFVP